MIGVLRWSQRSFVFRLVCCLVTTDVTALTTSSTNSSSICPFCSTIFHSRRTTRSRHIVIHRWIQLLSFCFALLIALLTLTQSISPSSGLLQSTVDVFLSSISVDPCPAIVRLRLGVLWDIRRAHHYRSPSRVLRTEEKLPLRSSLSNPSGWIDACSTQYSVLSNLSPKQNSLLEFLFGTVHWIISGLRLGRSICKKDQEANYSRILHWPDDWWDPWARTKRVVKSLGMVAMILTLSPSLSVTNAAHQFLPCATNVFTVGSFICLRRCVARCKNVR